MTDISADVLMVLRKAEIRENGNLLLSNEVLDRKLYTKTDAILKNIGYKWSKKMGLHIQENEEAFEKLSEAIDSGSYFDTRKELQFFPTPEKIVDNMLRMVENKLKGAVALEPSFGTGNILHKLIELKPKKVIGIEIDRSMFLKTSLEAKGSNSEAKESSLDLRNEDFLDTKIMEEVDVIVANPPFSKLRSAKHFIKMYEMLKFGGELVCILPTSDLVSDNSSSRRTLQAIIRSNTAEEVYLPEGEFKESGTNIPTVLIHLKKRS